MPDNSFPTLKLITALGKLRNPGYTNGDIIFINFFCAVFLEEYIEEDLQILYIHELIHTLDMNLLEKSVLFATDIVNKALKQ